MGGRFDLMVRTMGVKMGDQQPGWRKTKIGNHLLLESTLSQSNVRGNTWLMPPMDI
jgi:hypothetical protein